jgi:hypothetical protein
LKSLDSSYSIAALRLGIRQLVDHSIPYDPPFGSGKVMAGVNTISTADGRHGSSKRTASVPANSVVKTLNCKLFLVLVSFVGQAWR